MPFLSYSMSGHFLSTSIRIWKVFFSKAFLRILPVAFCLLFSPCLFGGVSPSQEFGELPKKSHPLDVLIEEKIERLSNQEYRFTVSNATQYSDTFFLNVYDIFVYTKLRRTEISDVENEFCQVFEKAIKTYNNIPQIRPFLKNFPIHVKDCGVWIEYGLGPRNYYIPPYFCLVYNDTTFNKIEFRKWEDPSNRNIFGQPCIQKNVQDVPGLATYINPFVPRLKTKLVEPIILDKQFKSRININCADLLYPIFIKMCSTYNLHIAAIGGCAFSFNDCRAVSAAYWTQNRRIDLEEAKRYTEEFIADYLEMLNAKKIVERQFKNDPKTLSDVRNNLNWFCFRISFWDEYMNRVEEPYIAQIHCQGGKIMYFTADEGQRLQQVFEEPVPEGFFPKSESL